MPKNKLSILLIKENTPTIIKMQEDIHQEEIAGYTFYYKNSLTNPPKWLGHFFNNQLQCGDYLRSTSAAGVLLVERQYESGNRIFAVCFGYGRSLIIPACIEERFGLVSTLNTINPNGLRSIDINRLDSSALKNRIQSSKLADVTDFEFNVEKSLLRQATGLSSDERMGKTISGSDSLSISVDVDIDTIGDILDRCYEKYCSTNYREAFSWIDHIKPLRKGTLTEHLNERLLTVLQNNDDDNTWLAIPDIIDWNDIVTLKYKQNGIEYEDILIDDFRREFADQEITLSFLKTNYVYAYDGEDHIKYKWSYYQCIYSEIEYNENLYILNAGNWYNVDRDYVRHIQDIYNAAPISDITFLNYNHDNENAYNRALADSSPNYHFMDVNLINIGIPNNNLEFCDVYRRDGKMIHIKKYGGSQVIGHLFNQGRVFGELLFVKNIREEVIERLPQDWDFPLDEFIPQNFEIVYGIINKHQNERPHIPFFSMVVFHDVYKTLTGFGYTVSLKSIHNERNCP